MHTSEFRVGDLVRTRYDLDTSCRGTMGMILSYTPAADHALCMINGRQEVIYVGYLERINGTSTID